MSEGVRARETARERPRLDKRSEVVGRVRVRVVCHSSGLGDAGVWGGGGVGEASDRRRVSVTRGREDAGSRGLPTATTPPPLRDRPQADGLTQVRAGSCL